jgi:PPOX class probable F420-dependent enzyme
MSVKSIPDSHLDLLEGPIYAVLTTVSAAGPENVVIWCSWDGQNVLVNTRGFSRKVKNIKANPKVALMAMDPQNPYRWLDVRGTVAEIAPDTDFSNINSHAKLYTNKDEYYGGVAPIERKGKEDRVVLRIKPERVFAFPPQG